MPKLRSFTKLKKLRLSVFKRPLYRFRIPYNQKLKDVCKTRMLPYLRYTLQGALAFVEGSIHGNEIDLLNLNLIEVMYRY